MKRTSPAGAPARRTLAFDVYGTLIDPLGVTERLRELVGDSAAAFAISWREKQLEYLFRRGLGRRYVPFSVCTRQALDFVCRLFGDDLSEAERNVLMDCYRVLPAYPESSAALIALAESGHHCFAFSNGDAADLAALISNAGLDAVLEGIVSVQAVESYKPDPRVYAHFLELADSKAEDTCLVSGNPFDVIGAIHAGWQAVWVRRNPAQVFDPWGIEPSATVGALDELRSVLASGQF